MNERHFKAIVQELIDENPFACRALLKIVSVEFTDAVPTLAVTCDAEPRLLVNLAFVATHCRTEQHVKAVICHEFLHVLLRHTDNADPSTAADHLALDAVINAIIHRELGPDYSDMMLTYYAKERGIHRLLRPWVKGEIERSKKGGIEVRAWQALYAGRLVADDVRYLACDLAAGGGLSAPVERYLGNHDDGDDNTISPAVAEAIERALKSMNGDGIWRLPNARGVGAHAYMNRVTASNENVERWRRQTWAVLRRHLLPDPRAPRTEQALAECHLPVLSPGDRRSFARALWSPLLPEAVWPSPRRISGGTAQIYLDVSGSMNAELPLIIGLLNRLGRHIRRPFWAFSNVVAPAVIRNRRLEADTTGGTSMNCVLRHLVATRPSAAVVVTDGYIEHPDTRLLQKLAGVRLHVVVTRDGSTGTLERAGFACTQLGRLPQ